MRLLGNRAQRSRPGIGCDFGVTAQVNSESISQLLVYIGVPSGIRTRVTAVKVRQIRHLKSPLGGQLFDIA